MIKKKLKIIWLAVVIGATAGIISGCREKQSSESSEQASTGKDYPYPIFSLVSPGKSGIHFNNRIQETEKWNILKYDYFYNGGGVAAGDINNDGLTDLFFTGNLVGNKLYLNKGNLKFEDITEKARVESPRWSTGVAMVDINSDGWLDIYVCNSGPVDKELLKNQLFINNQDLTFTEKASDYGIEESFHSTQATFFDFDKDGDLDLYVLNHSPHLNAPLKTDFRLAESINLTNEPYEFVRESSSALYLNEGGHFRDITEQAGLLKVGFGLGVIACDLNGDNWTDLYVANDFHIPDFMYINNGDGTFTDKIHQLSGHIPNFSMGCDAADINNDGLVDISTLDMAPGDHVRAKTLMLSMDRPGFLRMIHRYGFHPQYMYNAFQLNRGRGFFSDIGHFSGMAKTDWSWATLLADFDNDGLRDNFVTNGFKRDTKDQDKIQGYKKTVKAKGRSLTDAENLKYLNSLNSEKTPNLLFRNNGDYTFTNKTKEWGLSQPSFSNGALYADLDNDGDLEIVTNNIDDPAFIYKNWTTEKTGNHYLQIELIDPLNKGREFNAKIHLFYDGKYQSAELTPVRGYQSAVEPIVHFGLGKSPWIDSLIVDWLDGTQTRLGRTKTNRRLKISKDEATRQSGQNPGKNPLFIDLTNQQTYLTYKHRENQYDDYASEILLPHSQSRLGPFVAVGDANGDGMQDFFVGGAKGQAGKLFGQTPGGLFVDVRSRQPWKEDAVCEDMGSLFFDADNDKDLDLYVVSGGVDNTAHAFQDRLYINDGRGNFTKAIDALPHITSSGGPVKAADYDLDGDLDLFVGGRVVPGKYPFPATSYILQNEGGKFRDVTKAIAPDLEKAGLVTDAVWTDFNRDGQPDLIVVGEWMPISFYENQNGRFHNVTSMMGLEKSAGWWYCITAADVNQDGREDYIVGNVGKNTKFKASKEKPFHVFCHDFDDNGTFDIVLSTYYRGNLVPVRGKECSTEQMPFLKEKTPTFKKFANASLPDILGKSKLQEGLHYEAYTFESTVLINKGNSEFELRPLPAEAQFSPINGIIAYDFDKDSHLDLLIAGNMFQTEVETPRYDAGIGLFLKGDGKGNFQAIPFEESGFFAARDVKDLQFIRITSTQYPGALVTNNDGFLQIFARK